MEVKLLNNVLGTKFIPVLFCCSPIAIPINDDGVTVSEDEATDVHYSTLVWNVRDKEFSILEFDKAVKRSLAQYSKRHHGLDGLEILVFRDPEDNRFRMTIGNTEVDSTGPDELTRAAELQDALTKEYLTNVGYKVSDRGI